MARVAEIFRVAMPDQERFPCGCVLAMIVLRRLGRATEGLNALESEKEGRIQYVVCPVYCTKNETVGILHASAR